MKARYKRTKLGKIPEDWDLKKIQEIAQINMGQSPKSSDCNDSGNGLPFFQGNADFGFKYPVCKSWTTTPTKIALPNDILMSVRAPVGALNFANTKCCIGRGLCSIKPNNRTNLFYLYYALLYSVPRLHSRQQGSTFTAVNKSDLNTFLLPTPSFPEQNKIAEILSTVDDAIEKTDDIIEETQQLKKVLMEKLFTEGIGHKQFKKTRLGKIPSEWDVAKIGAAVKFQGGFAFKSRDYCEKGIRSLRISNVSFSKTLWNDVAYLPYDYKEKFPEYLLGEDDIIMAMTRPIIAGGIKIAKLNDDDVPSLLNQRVGRFQIKKKLNTNFLYYLLFSEGVQKAIFNFSVGSNQPNISSKQIENIIIPFPPPDEQLKIANILSEVESKLKNEVNYKSELEQLKKGLLQVLLTGKVRVKV